MRHCNRWMLAAILTLCCAINVSAQRMDDATPEAGSHAPNFTLTDLNGQKLSLTSLRGKYVVLDFWATWCGWCIKGFPKMKKYYEKHRDKLEIVGMNCSDPVDEWKEAVDEYDLPWPQVNVPKDSKVFDDYIISGLPTKVIINPQGKVVTTYLGEDKEFYDILDKTLK